MRRVLPAMLALALAACSVTAVQAKTDNNPAAQVASFAAGSIVGLPISVVRHQYIDVTGFTRDFVGNSKNPILWGVGVPLCFVSGVVEGMFAGIAYDGINAWKGSQQAPFSQKCFSLGSDIER